MKTAASKFGMLCLAAGLLSGCETVSEMASATGDTVGGWYNSAKNSVVGSDRSYIGRQVGDGLDEADAISISRESAKALERSPAGKTVNWRNPKTGASAKITPGETVMEKRKIQTARKKGVAPSSSLLLIGKTYQAKKNANLRSGPGTKHPVVGGLAAGEKMIAVGKVERSDWIMVSMNGKVIGYVFASLVAPSKKQSPDLREAGEAPDVADGDQGKDVVIDTITVSTACRKVDYEVITGDGESAKDEFQACRAHDGDWEIN
jgi:surface antigen